MTKEDFKAWREHMGFTRTQACDALGLGRDTPQRYEDGKANIPLYVALACAASAHGLSPWVRDDDGRAGKSDRETVTLSVTHPTVARFKALGDNWRPIMADVLEHADNK
ncbi:helix-turn-helix domain-containing protein (plasmid) [Devosia sp. A8/3-2]|nr:helix-turn-helix domain-containing protein [Devosia sp. A8/3-2]